jgi:hypothetical protein
MRGVLLIVLPPLNGMLKTAGLPPIVPSTEEIKSPSSRVSLTPASDDDEVEK